LTPRPGLAAAVAAAARRAAENPDQADNRDCVITIRVTAQERYLLDTTATRQGETLSAFIRASALDVARAIRDMPEAEA
jgi:uncharacterized protein (DUF1778 family)